MSEDVSVANRNLSLLAPKFERGLFRLMHAMWLAGEDPIVYEAFRSNARQTWLYAQGRTRPGDVVTNAKDAMHGYHFFGMAADLISRAREWNYSASYVALIEKLTPTYGLAWGGAWPSIKDQPHVQWGNMPDAPTDAMRDAYAAEVQRTGDPYDGRKVVWKMVGAL